jgi:hypothetical protein
MRWAPHLEIELALRHAPILFLSGLLVILASSCRSGAHKIHALPKEAPIHLPLTRQVLYSDPEPTNSGEYDIWIYLTNGGCVYRGTNLDMSASRVQWSTNLIDWRTVPIITNSDYHIDFTEDSPFQLRFWRLQHDR